jgi:hypothetical protein
VDTSPDRLAQLGSLARVPYVRWTAAQLTSAKLDSKAGYVLWLVDGRSSVEAIVDLAGVPADEALAIVCDLWSRGILAFK